MKKDYYTKKLSEWNDAMYIEHPTPYDNLITGIIERKRVETILNLCRINKNDEVLEIGCESGQIISRIKKAKRIVGIDISDTALLDAKNRLNGNTELIFADAEKPINNKRLANGSFDVVICSQTLEHVAKPKAVLKNILRLARKDARIVISVPNELFMLRIKRLLHKTNLMKILLPGIEPEISEWHLQVFTDRKFRNLLNSKFSFIESKKVFNIYLVYFLSKR